MKLKPLLKTHWVASQNPLMISMGGLRRVVFTPPAEVLKPHFFVGSEEPKELPALSELQILGADGEETRQISQQKFTLSRDLFWTVFSGHDMGTMGAPSAALTKLAQSLEFHFEDGQCLLLPGAYRKAGFPLFLSAKFYLQDPSCNWERALAGSADELMKSLKIAPHQRKSLEFKKTWLMILEMLAWALQRKRQVGDLEVLWSQPGVRTGFDLQDIEFHKELPLVATVKAEPALPGSAQIRVWQGSEKLSTEGVLQFHSEEILSELENYFLGPTPDEALRSYPPTAEEMEVLQKSAKPLQWQSQFSTTEAHAQDLLRSIAKIEASLGRHNLYFVDHVSITSSEFRPFLKVKNSEGFLQMAASFEVDAFQLQHLNFPVSLTPILALFKGGLDEQLKLERKDVAARHPQYRTNDLLFLRHQGLLIFCLFELINWILKKPMSSGEEIEFIENLETPEADQQFEKVIHYLQSAIPALLGQPGTAYKNLISPKVQALFTDFIEKLFHNLMHDRTLVIQSGKLIEIHQVQSQTLPLVRFLILHFIEASRGKFLTRTQLSVGERFLEALPYWTEPRIVPKNFSSPGFGPHWMELGVFDQYSVSLLFELCDQGIDVELNGTSLRNQENPFEFTFSVTDAANKEDGNWFDLHPQIFFNGTRVSTEEVKINFGQGQVGFIEYQGQIYRIDKKLLPSLKSLQRFWNKIKGLRQVQGHGSFGDRVYRLEKSQALELLMLKTQGFEVQVEGEWKRIFDYFQTGLGVEKIELPKDMQKSLLPHQLEGAQWLHDLYELKLGALLADEMGLGKTFQILSFLTSLQKRNQLGKCLIIVPTSLVYNWVDEKKKFSPDLPLRVFQTSEQGKIKEALQSPEPMVLIATYGLLIENPDFFQAQAWNVLAFDEAQNLKNITSVRSVCARKLNAQFKVCITGTPMENNYLEFFSLCDLVVPGSLGDIDAFRKEYYNREVRIESLRELRLISKPLLLRRTKMQVKLSLPEKTVERVRLPFGEKQKEIYKKMAMTFSRQVEDLIQDQGERKAQIAMFAALMRLRQICSDPAAVPGVVYQERPAKVEHFLNSLQDHLENQESVVVFTQFLSTLKRLESELQKMKVPTYTLQGSVSAKERVRLISEFQASPEPGVMLMTLKTGGVGLNLTKASVVYHLEPWWNPAVENQATDRAHRMGQTKNVKVFNLLIEGSLEERIADLKLKKQDSFDRLFNVEEQVEESGFEGSNSLSREDFLYLLK